MPVLFLSDMSPNRGSLYQTETLVTSLNIHVGVNITCFNLSFYPSHKNMNTSGPLLYPWVTTPYWVVRLCWVGHKGCFMYMNASTLPRSHSLRFTLVHSVWFTLAIVHSRSLLLSFTLAIVNSHSFLLYL